MATKKSPKACLRRLVPSLELGNVFERGSASCQATGGGASQNGFPAWRLRTSQSKGCIFLRAIRVESFVEQVQTLG
ncbi:hypothetical protein [Nostoc sp.]|uniref:hypothetical protein n=1 Tax=Nostoc sp. TaxID=1180 RepID=UPI002FF5B31C